MSDLTTPLPSILAHRVQCINPLSRLVFSDYVRRGVGAASPGTLEASVTLGGQVGLAQSMAVSVIVPVYNGAPTLPELVTRLSTVLSNCAIAYEIILVDDGSEDSSWDVINRLATDHDQCRGIGLMRNYGQHNALLAGIRQARYEVIVTIDDDLQNPPEEIPILLAEFASGADVIYGAPLKAGHGIAAEAFLSSHQARPQGHHGGRRRNQSECVSAFRTVLRDGFSEASGPAVNIDVLLGWSTSRFHAVVVRQERRAVGKSNYTFRKLVNHALNMLTGFSTQPLRFASLIGFTFTLIGVGTLRVCTDSLFHFGWSRSGFCFLGVNHLRICRSSALYYRDDRRISSPHASPNHGETHLRRRKMDANPGT